MRRGRRQRRGFLPFRQPAPDFQGLGGRGGVGRPRAAATNGAQPQPAWPMRAARPAASRLSARCGPAPGGAAAPRRGRAARRRRLPGRRRAVEVERQRQAARGGGGRAGRQHEGEQLQQIVRRAGAGRGGGRWPAHGPGAAAAGRAERERPGRQERSSSPSGVTMAARPWPATSDGASGRARRGSRSGLGSAVIRPSLYQLPGVSD